MATGLSDLRFALRSLRKTPGFTTVAVLTFGLCVGANSAIFSLVNSVLLRPLPHDDPSKLVLVWESAPFFGLQDSPVAPANYSDWKARARSFAEMSALEDNSYRLTGDGEPEVVHGAVVTASLWRILRTRPARGRVFTDAEDQIGVARVAVVSDAFWRGKLASDPHAVGRTLLLNEERYAIVGVLEPGSEPPSEYSGRVGEVWTSPNAAYTPEELANRGRHNWMVIARLKPDVSITAADTEMQSIGRTLAREFPQTNERVGAFVAPMRDHFIRDGRKTIYLLLGTVAVLLLIGCSNLANLLITRAAGRAKEVAVRTALGAGFWRVVRRYPSESLLMCAMGGFLGLLMAPATFEFLAHLAPSPRPQARVLFGPRSSALRFHSHSFS